MRLGKRQKEIIALMKTNPDSFFIHHKKYNGKMCFRLMSSEMSPIANVKLARVHKLLDKGVLFISGRIKYYLK